MAKILLQSVLMLLVSTLITGIAYPLVVTAIAQACCRQQAEGSLIRHGDKLIGSSLIGQPFDDPKYFWSRPSATGPAYNGASSGASNLGPTNSALHDAVKGR